MKKKSLGRAAAVAAAAATVGGMLPFFAMASAFAAEPTAITVTPTAAYTNTHGTATFTGTLTGASGTLNHGVFADIFSGPDANPATPLAGSACDVTGATYSCTVTNGGQPGVDSIHFFYDAAGTGSYQSGDPVANATLTIGGQINAVTLTPTTAHAAQGQYQAYTVSATDAQGRPVSGASITVTASQANATNGDLTVTGTKPAAGANTGLAAPTAGGNGTASGAVTTGDGTASSTPGAATVYIASKVVGTVSLVAKPTDNTITGVSSTGTLTVDAAGVNDVTSVAVTPPTQNAFTNKAVQETITLRNAQGDPVAGVTPVVNITAGPDAGTTVTVGATDGTGTATATYTSGSAAGTDTVQAFVNQTDNPVNTGGLDPGEPSGTASVVIAANHVAALTGGTTTNVPVDTASVPVTFTLTTDNGSSPAGYNVNFTVAPTSPAGKYTLSQTSAVTDANGKVTVSVTNANPAAGDSATVTATLVGDATKTGSDTVNWQARSVATNGIVISPFVNTAPVHTAVTHTVTATDQFGQPVNGLTYTWSVNGRNNALNNTGATGTGSSFTYTDAGPATSGGVDTITVTATSTSGTTTTVVGSDSVNQYWVTGTAQATQANIDATPWDGQYTQATPTSPFVPVGFEKSTTAGVTSDPTAANPSSNTTPIGVKLIDANGNPLYGKSVTFTSAGVGGFTDANGKPIGSSTTALVEDSTCSNGSPCNVAGWATVYVRSTQSGTQTITASVDGITDHATVTYTGQYVPVTPERVLDSRTGQGALANYNGGSVPAGRLAKNTVYYFSYNSTDMPLYANSYAFNVTAIQPNAQGNLRVAPVDFCGSNQAPQTSLINYQVGKDTANFVVVPNNGECGRNTLAIYSDGASVSVAIDLVGYYPSSDGINDITPTRVADTRTGLGGGSGPVTGGTSRSFQIAGNAGIPVGAKAVALNVTAIRPTGLGNLRVYPDGASVPNASNINYIPGVDKAAFVVVNLPADGKIDVYSDGGTVNVAVDAFAYYPTTSTMVTAAPTRILDTRTTSPLAADTVRSFQVTGKAGVPADAQAVLVSVTGIHTAGSTGVGNLRIYPTGSGLPNVSTLNYVSKTSDVANFAIVKLGTNGQLSLYSAGSRINVAVDVVGYIPAGA